MLLAEALTQFAQWKRFSFIFVSSDAFLYYLCAMSDTREQKILLEVTKVFMQYGIKSVNMDDLARHLSVSKKTLYLYFTDKEDLVRKAVAAHCMQEDADVQSICHKGLNAIEEMLEIMQMVIGMLKNIHPSVQFDLQKYHPEVYKAMKENRDRAVFDCMIMNTKKGQREGYYRKDFNAEVINKVYIGRMDLIFDQTIFPITQFTLSELYKEIFSYHIRGIASDKGMEYLEQKLKSKKRNT
jgi:TetR/AcrR family transcriptional regulator, cholesterol catabolism regulator